MTRDPIVRKIVSHLNDLAGAEDGDRFEACAIDLLRGQYPTLRAVPGGSDDGYDGIGETAEGIIQAICTVDADPLKNLNRSIGRADKRDGRTPARLILLATSRKISPQKERQIHELIRAAGHHPLPVMGQQRLVPLLRRNPYWRKELLGVTGDPPALSDSPVSTRPHSEIGLIGRTDVLEEIRSSKGDILVVAQPGTGKTFLLRKLAEAGEALFLVSANWAEVADQLREAPPRFIIVDDAFSRRDSIPTLRQLRDNCRNDFQIIATCWPNYEDKVTRSFGGEQLARIPLSKLSGAEIVQVARALGIAGPDQLLHEIIHQSNGKPGLTVMLCQGLLNNEKDSLENTLPQQARSLIDEIGLKNGLLALALSAIGGSAGVHTELIASALGISDLILHQEMEQLATGGLVETRQDQKFVVTPQRLGQTLANQVLFSTSPPLRSLSTLINALKHEGAMWATLGVIRSMGGRIDRHLIESGLCDLREAKVTEHGTGPYGYQCWIRYSVSDFIHAIQAYAQCGEAEALWCIETFPECLPKLARPCLHLVPEDFLLHTLQQATKDPGRETELFNVVRNWLEAAYPGATEFFERRKLLQSVLSKLWKKKKVSESVAGKAIGCILSVTHDSTASPPGEEMVVTMRRGSATPAIRSKILNIWRSVLPILRKLKFEHHRPTLERIHAWTYPDAGFKGMPESEYRKCRAHAKILVSSYLDAMNDWAFDFVFHTPAKSLRIGRVAQSDPLLDTVMPREERWTEGGTLSKRRSLLAKRLGHKANDGDAAQVCKRLAHARCCVKDELQFHYLDDHTPAFLEGVFEKTSNPRAWTKAIFDSKLHFLAGFDYIDSLASADPLEFNRLLKLLLASDHYFDMAARLALKHLTHRHPLWADALAFLEKHPYLVRGPAGRREIHPTLYSDLLANGSKVALAICAAIDPDETGFSPEILAQWKEAMVLQDRSYQTHQFGERFPDVRFQWLKHHLGTFLFSHDQYVDMLIGQLSKKERAWIKRHRGI